MVYGKAYKMLHCFLTMRKWRVHDMSILLYPARSGWERIVDVVPGGTELELQLGRPHTLAIS